MEISLSPESLFHIGSFPVTNTLVMTFALSLFIIIYVLVLRSNLQLIPRGFQNIFEWVVEAFLDLIDGVT